MARLSPIFLVLAGGLAGAPGCDKVVGLGGAPTPLASLQVQVTGDDATASASHLQVAVVWGAEWLPEPFCFLPPESPDAAAVIQAGCPDSFGFVPRLVAASAPVQPGVPTTILLFDLPSADVMVGDLTGRVAYASLVLYDDVNQSGTLELRSSGQPQAEDLDGGLADDAGFPILGGPNAGDRRIDVVHGASFVGMTTPDLRLAYREGAFVESAFYPRSGCDDPPAGFSILGAGGFSGASAIASALAGQLPPEDPARCSIGTLAQTVVPIVAQAPAAVSQVDCTRRNANGIPRYRKPPSNMPQFGGPWACVSIPDLGSLGGAAVDPSADAGAATTSQRQLVVATPADSLCKSVTHYVLRGCDNDPSCDPPSWDQTATPPAWWPCGAP